MTFKPRVTPVIIGTEFINGGIKTLGVVHFKPVAQFVYYHAVDDLGRREHKQTVKVQIPFAVQLPQRVFCARIVICP